MLSVSAEPATTRFIHKVWEAPPKAAIDLKSVDGFDPTSGSRPTDSALYYP